MAFASYWNRTTRELNRFWTLSLAFMAPRGMDWRFGPAVIPIDAEVVEECLQGPEA